MLLTAALAACGGNHEAGPLVEQWSLVEELRYGAEDGPGSLADIRGIVLGDSGHLLVLDFKDQQIHVFDSLGTYLRAIGRRGQGPGEFGNANGMLRAPDGRIWINDPDNGRFTVLASDGSLHATHPVRIGGYGYLWQAWFDSSGTLYESVSVRVDTSYGRRLQRYRMEAIPLRSDTLPRYPCDSVALALPTAPNYYRTPRGYMDVPFMISPVRAIDPNVGAWCATGERYGLHQVTLDDHPTGVVVHGSRPPTPVSVAERDSAIANVRRFFEQTGGANPDLSRIPSEKPVIRSLQVDAVGRLWAGVNSSDGGSTWDLFDVAGRPLATAHAGFGVNPWHPLHFQGDRVYAVASDTDVPTIVRARLVRAPLAEAGKAR